MTTVVTVKVPPGANYQAEVVVANETNSPTNRVMTVKPDTQLDLYIYGNMQVTSIREVPLN